MDGKCNSELSNGMDPQAWAQLALQNQWYQTTEHKRGIEALRAVLNHEKPPSEAAREIATIYGPSVSKQAGELGDLYVFWEIFCDAVRRVGLVTQQSERLADTLGSLAGLPDLTDTHGRAVTTREGWAYWRDLPHFSWMWRDYGNRENFNDILDEDGDKDDWYAKVTPLFAATTFSSTYSARIDFDEGRQWDAEVALRAIFPNPVSNDIQDEPIVLSARLWVAATWMLIAGQAIHAACLRGDYSSLPSPENAAEGGHVAFSSTNWDSWKERIQHLARMPTIDPRSREHARQASACMQSLDQSSA